MNMQEEQKYLYPMPPIDCISQYFRQNKGYKVSEIEYNDNREITHITLVNRFGKVVYTWNINNPENPPVNNNNNNIPCKSNIELLKEFCGTKKLETGIDIDRLTKFYNYYSTKDFKGKMNVEQLWERWIKPKN